VSCVQEEYRTAPTARPVPRRSPISGIANPSTASTLPAASQGAESPISAVPRTLDFTSTRHRVAHSERLDFTSEKFGLYQRARFPIRQAESMVYRSYPLDSSSAS
jgi:hypothetical protein